MAVTDILQSWRRMGLPMAMSAVASFVLIGTARSQSAESPNQPPPKTHTIILGFDLRDDAKPRATLVVNSPPAANGNDVNVAIPIVSSDVSSNEGALFRVGSYSSWTLVTFSTAGSSWPQQLSFTPAADSSRDGYEIAPADSGTIFLEAEGQYRRFRYHYPSGPHSGTSNPTAATAFHVIDAINIKLPLHAHEIAVRPGRLSVPDRLPGEDAFPGEAPNGNTQFLEVAYEVPLTSFQNVVIKYAMKLFAVIVPIFGLWTLGPTQIQRPRLRPWLIGTAATLSLVLVGAIAWTVWTATQGTEDLLIDVAIFVLTSAVSVSLRAVGAKGAVP